MYSDYFSLSAYSSEWWQSSLLLIYFFPSLLSPISSFQVLEKLEAFGIRLAALTPLLAPVCRAPPVSWACWILKASLRFWVRTSLLWISSTTRLGNQPLSPSWSLSPIIQPRIQRTKYYQRWHEETTQVFFDFSKSCVSTHRHLFSLGGSKHRPSQWTVHLAPEMSMTEYIAPVESLIQITHGYRSYLQVYLRTVLSVGVIFCLTWLMGTSRHKACAPVRSESTHPSKLITPVHRMTQLVSSYT